MSRATNTGTEVTIASLCELDDVQIYETGSRLDAAFKEDGSLKLVTGLEEAYSEAAQDGSESKEVEVHELELHIAVGFKRLECRARLLVRDRSGRYLVDAGIKYKSPQGLHEFPRETILNFIQTTAFPALFPFILGELYQGAARIGTDRRTFVSLSAEILNEVLSEGLHEERADNEE